MSEKGIIIENISNLYRVKLPNKPGTSGKIFEATARGKFKKDEITPVVGDKVKLNIIDERNNKAVIEEIKERRIFVKRPKLANLTQIVFVVSSKKPKPDLLMLDKQLVFAEFLGIKSIIILNKIDLDKEQDFTEIEKVYKKIGYNVIETEAKNNETGIEELMQNLRGNISAFSGNSGVGKSTLINRIFNKNITLEGEISKRNKRGKNTTTATKLYEIEDDSYIADTPGFSTFDVSEIKSNDLAKYFKEFKAYINDCEFVGCTHVKEENCGIKKAIEEDKIDISRYNRFCKIYEELKQKEEYKKW